MKTDKWRDEEAFTEKNVKDKEVQIQVFQFSNRSTNQEEDYTTNLWRSRPKYHILKIILSVDNGI
jgi:hypothetical protein